MIERNEVILTFIEIFLSRIERGLVYSYHQVVAIIKTVGLHDTDEVDECVMVAEKYIYYDQKKIISTI